MWLDDLRPLSPGAPTRQDALPADAFRPFCLDRHGVTEAVTASLPFGLLRSFARTSAPGSRADREEARRRGPGRRVLVVAPLAGAFPFLMRDLVVALLDHADEVSITDWPNARFVPATRGRFGFAENAMEVAQMVRALGEDVHVVGVCQGVVPALVATLLLADGRFAPSSLSLLGGPVDPTRNPTRLWQVLQGRALADIERDVLETVSRIYAGAGRRVFPAWRQMETFALYLWRQSLAGKELPLKLAFDEGDDPRRFPLARLCWSMMDVPGEFFVENVDAVFKRNALARGTLDVAGKPVDPRNLSRTALCCVEGTDDDIAAPGQTVAAHDLCINVPERLKRSLRVPGAGHFSLFYGAAMRAMVVPALAATMTDGEEARVADGRTVASRGDAAAR